LPGEVEIDVANAAVTLGEELADGRRTKPCVGDTGVNEGQKNDEEEEEEEVEKEEEDEEGEDKDEDDDGDDVVDGDNDNESLEVAGNNNDVVETAVVTTVVLTGAG
jgi:hypothetical protein